VSSSTASGTAPFKARAVAEVGEGVLDTTAWRVRIPRLPVWPLVAMFTLTPIWWALGVFFVIWPFFGVALFVLLTVRGRVLRPAGTMLWLIFLGIVLVTATRLEHVTSMVLFTLRLGHLVTAFLVGVYVYNLAREGTPWSRIVNPLLVFWLCMVAFGWAGVLFPKFSMASPFQSILPHGIASERYITDITQLETTEFSKLSPNPIYRPAAPFPYTNNWGTAYCFLVPFVLACLTVVRRRWMTVVLLASLALSIVPAYKTLNRGMFIGLGLGVLYLLGRELARGRVRLLLPVAGLVLIGWIITLFVPVFDLITARTTTSATNRDRFDLYVQTWAAVMHAPLLGYGQPNQVDTTFAAEPLGTQGMIWQLLYSHGIPATICFYLIFAVIARRMSTAVTRAGLWLSALPVIAVVVTPFYSFLSPIMSILFCGVGLGLAAVDGPINRSPG
jgi:hypothetical protein